VAAHQRQVRQAERLEEIKAVLALDQQLIAQCQVHQEEFVPAEAVQAQPPAPVDEREIRRRLEGEAVEGIPRLKLAERRAARQTVLDHLDFEIQREAQLRAEEATKEQTLLDDGWKRLQANDPETVLGVLEAAFSDNEAPAAAVSCRDARVDIVMRWPVLDEVVPERKGAATPSGQPTIHKRNKTERADF
jgi:hypothetical protein